MKQGKINIQVIEPRHSNGIMVIDTTSKGQVVTKPIMGRSFHLSEVEAEAFAKSGSKKLMFEFGGGIGYKVMYEDKKGKWVDITDYSLW